jgi:hypothetical protein
MDYHLFARSAPIGFGNVEMDQVLARGLVVHMLDPHDVAQEE